MQKDVFMPHDRYGKINEKKTRKMTGDSLSSFVNFRFPLFVFCAARQ
jgi:hypothetical protein